MSLFNQMNVIVSQVLFSFVTYEYAFRLSGRINGVNL